MTSKTAEMSVDAVSLSRTRSLPRSLLRARDVPDTILIGVIVALASAARFAASVPHTTPRYFPDEYLYSALARSLAHGSLQIRGEPAHFPALLESIVTAPVWLTGGIELPFRLVQLVHAIVAALAVVPVFAVARRLGLPRWQQLSCAALTPLLPVFVFVSYLTADVLGATLALAAFAAGVGALVMPSLRREAAFIGLAALATLARFQYVVVIPAFALAALAMCGWRPVETLRRFRLIALTIACGGATALALGPAHLLGYYEGLLAFDLSPVSMGKWAATDLMLLVYATGVALGPAAAVGFATTLVRPRTAAERGFALMTASVLGALLLEVALYATNGSDRFQERYLIVLLPLVVPYACLGMQRAGARRTSLAIVGAATLLALVATRVSLTDYVLNGNGQDSPTLQAVSWLVQHVGTGDAGLSLSLGATAVLVVAAAAAVRPRAGVAVVLGVAAAVLVSSTAASVADDIRASRSSTILALGKDARWVDHTGMGPVQTLVPRDAIRWIVSQQLFWNKTLTRVLTLPGAPDADALQNTRVSIDGRGVLREGSRPVTGPLLVQEYASSAQVDDADLVARRNTTSLWRPHGVAHFVSLTDGRYFDGWLGWPYGMVTVWPQATGPRSGVLCLPFRLPDFGAPVTLDIWAPGYRRAVTIPPGGHTLVTIRHTVTGAWRVHMMARRPFRIGPRLLSAIVERPHFITGKASAAACR